MLHLAMAAKDRLLPVILTFAFERARFYVALSALS